MRQLRIGNNIRFGSITLRDAVRKNIANVLGELDIRVANDDLCPVRFEVFMDITWRNLRVKMCIMGKENDYDISKNRS